MIDKWSPTKSSIYKRPILKTNLDLHSRSQSEKLAIIKSLCSSEQGKTKFKSEPHKILNKRKLEKKRSLLNCSRDATPLSSKPSREKGGRSCSSRERPNSKDKCNKHHHSPHQHAKQPEKSLGLHTRLKSYTFREVVKIIGLLVNSTKNCRSHAVRAAEQNLQVRLMSLQQIRQAQRIPGNGQELMFDAGYFSSAASKNRYVRLNSVAKATLTLPSQQRSLHSLQQVHKLFLQMKLLSQYPHQMQIKLCKVGYYSSFSASRVIIRQGHRPFYFYILISGSVLVNETSKNDGAAEMFVTTRCVLEKGAQFGETALLLNSFRNATVVCQSDVELLVIDKKDFLPLFASHIKSGTAHVSTSYKDIEHLQYLSERCEPFRRFPMNIFYTNPMSCVVHYFRKGSVIVKSINTEWLYVVKSGTCRVVTSIPLEKSLKENARQIIESLRKQGFGEVEIYDLEFNSAAQKEQISRIREYIETPPPVRSQTSVTTMCSKCADCEREGAKSRVSVRSRCNLECLHADSGSTVTRTAAQISAQRSISLMVQSVTQLKKNNAPELEPDKESEKGSGTEQKVCFFVCVRILKPGDTFGFETIVNECPDIPLSIISNNAECVMLSKKLYQNFVPPDILISIKARCQNFPYPSSRDISLNLAEQWKWFSYKKHLLCDTLMTHDLNRQFVN